MIDKPAPRPGASRFQVLAAAMIGGAAGLLACATADTPGPTASGIEPPPHTIEPPRAKPTASAAGADRTFVFSRARKAQAPTEEIVLHVSEKWWRFRGDRLKLTEAQARDRDNAVSEKEAPADFWDAQTAREAVETWTAVCNECHGGRRRVEDAVTMPVPPPKWGKGEGLFFGQRRPYADVFSVIYKGGPERNGERSEMPAWRGKLAKEMIWSLLYFLEYQSGGIEGRFPPSLYPRQSDEAKRNVE